MTHPDLNFEQFWRRRHLSLWIPLACYVFFLLWINPFYEYTQGSDRVYAWSVLDLAKNHVLRIPNASVSSLVWQTVWGYLFTLPLGFSFSALHLSTIVVFIVGVIFWYRTLRLFQISEEGVFAGTFLLIALPQIPLLSITFNTDVPSLSYWLMALFFYLRYLRGRAWTDLAGGAVASSLGVLVRQTNLLLPIAVWLALWMAWRTRDANSPARAGRATSVGAGSHVTHFPGERALRYFLHLLPLLVLGVFYFVLYATHHVPAVWAYQHWEVLNLNRILDEVLKDPVYMLQYFAMFLLPVFVALVASRDFYGGAVRLWRHRPWPWVTAAIFLTVAGLTFWRARFHAEWLPYFKDDAYLSSDLIPWKWNWITVLTTLLAVLVAAWLLPSIALFLIALQRRLALSRAGRVLTRRRVRRTLEVACAALAAAMALPWTKPVFVGIGTAGMKLLYDARGYLGGPHRYSLEFWGDQTAYFYSAHRWMLCALVLAFIPLISFLAGNPRITRWLEDIRTTEFDALGPEGSGKRGFSLRALFLSVALILTSVAAVVISLRFDRYLIMFFPLLALIVLQQVSRIRINRPVLAISLVLFLVFSALNASALRAPDETHWRAYADLMKQGVPVDDIDVGLFQTYWFNEKAREERHLTSQEQWRRDHPLYTISQDLVPGYRAVKLYRFNNPFKGEQFLFVLKRDDSAPAAENSP